MAVVIVVLVVIVVEIVVVVIGMEVFIANTFMIIQLCIKANLTL